MTAILEPSAATDLVSESITLRGVRVHNLQNLDLDIPRDKFVVVTGPSGSGKSSLAFDTIYAEGQRQYVESLSAQARQWLHQLERPDADLIEGLQPTIAIDQRLQAHNPRSTVATVTEIYDFLRLLMARLGTPFCSRCNLPIRPQSPEQIVEDLLKLPEGTRAMVLAPMVRGRKGQHTDVLAAVWKAQLVRVRVDGTVYELENVPELDRHRAHDIESVVDRIVVRPGGRERIADAVALALKHGQGQAVVSVEVSHDDQRGAWQDRFYSTMNACPQCGASYERIEPRTFSFASPYGACPECDGLGCRAEFDPELVIPDPKLSLAKGALAPWRKGAAAVRKKLQQDLAPFSSETGVSWDEPLENWPEGTREKLVEGSGEFPGVLTMLKQELSTATDDDRREELESFIGEVPCAACGGTRLRPEARSVRLDGLPIHEISARTVSEAITFFENLNLAGEREAAIAERVLPEIVRRLKFLDKVGVGYLTLGRPAQSLSGGELQRVRLATGIGSGLIGACYVLDEPSIGLHPRDNARLIAALRELQALGNTVIVVEHDEEIIRQADVIFDLGPGAGRHGGRLIAQGTPQEVAAVEDSPTGRFLSGRDVIELPSKRRPADLSHALVVEGASGNNLCDLTVRFPLATFICVTGVSGSGKSTLVNETLARAVARNLYGAGAKPAPYRRLAGLKHVDKLIQIDQSPIGRTPRSNAATFTGLWDEIRRAFAATREAKVRGFGSGRFSFNVKGGRCETCQGQGVRRIEMNFLPDLFVTCEDCRGKRFNRQTLAVPYRGRSIADVLEMSVDEARSFFENFPVMVRVLDALHEVGLGYLALGQPSTTLSGGEAQRVKLAAELARVATGKTLYVLDEPTTGLHLSDVKRLLAVLQRLVDLGNTVVVIEHHLDVVKSSDWIIDLGPEGGAAGGRLVAEGTPEQVAAMEASQTGACLRLAQRAAS
ncbi:MAG: excinuclease ABC subunit UvrA [Planctomycetia bacterium]|nr:excinuclease ABC subunit UvrA [Planctomycetia bacterium]